MAKKKEISFDVEGFLEDLRKDTKAWGIALKHASDAITGMLGKVKTTVKTVEKPVKPTVAGFDQIERLNGKDVTVTTTVDTVQGALKTLTETISGLGSRIKGAVKLYFSGKLPQAKFENATKGIMAVMGGIAGIQSMLRGDTSTALWFSLFSGSMAAAGSELENLMGLLARLSASFTGVGTASQSLWNAITTLWDGASLWFSDKLFTPIQKGTQQTVDSGFAALNGATAAVQSVVNSVGSALNAIKVEVPAWVPGFGGKTFGFHIPTIEIPKLAKGGVLPANKPFLAMVGDQKHGTNIEAPLATIQEAVALVLDEQVGAITAGFEASVGVQREILEAVLGIRIGDELIATAGDRYRQKMAVARGGTL